MKLKSGHAARKIQIVNKYDEKMLTYFIDLFEFVRNNNIFNEQIFDLNISDAAIYMYGHNGNFHDAKKLLFERDDVKKYPEEIICEFVKFVTSYYVILSLMLVNTFMLIDVIEDAVFT